MDETSVPRGKGAGIGGLRVGVAKRHLLRFGPRAPVGRVHGEQRERRKEDCTDDGPSSIGTEGQRMLYRLFHTVAADEPAQRGGDAEIADERHRTDPRKGIGGKRGGDDEQSDDGSERREDKGKDGVGVKLPDMLRQSAEGVEEVANDAAAPAKLLFEQNGEIVGHCGPAERVVVDVGTRIRAGGSGG